MGAFMIVVISLGFSLAIVKLSLDHHEKIERIKHGLPIDGDRKDSFDGPKNGFN